MRGWRPPGNTIVLRPHQVSSKHECYVAAKNTGSIKISRMALATVFEAATGANAANAQTADPEINL